MSKPLPLPIRVWFAADALLALAPPLHWVSGGAEPILGVPRVVVYLFGSSLFVSASIVAAYLLDGARR